MNTLITFIVAIFPSKPIFYITNILSFNLIFNTMKKFSVRGFLKLVRIDLCLFGAIGLYVAGLISGDLVAWSWDYFWVFLMILLIGMGSFAINDFKDYETDKINQLTDRPLVNGTITRKFAKWFSIVSIILTLLLSFLVDFVPQMIIIGSSIVFYVYSLGGKKILGLKNILVSLSYFLVVILGTLLENLTIEPIFWYFATMGFIVGLAGEVLFDIRDTEGDSKANVHTFANRFGKKTAAWIVVILLATIMIMDPIPALVNIDTRLYHDWLFFGLILIPVIGYGILSFFLLKNQEQKRIKLMRKIIIPIMQFGTLSYLIGVLVN